MFFYGVSTSLGGAYDRRSGTIFLPAKSRASFITSGGLYHEWFHALIAQKFGDPKRTVKTVPVACRDVISDSYEEIVAHMLASRFVDKNKYSQMVKEKYGLHSEKDAEDYILGCLTEDFVIDEIPYRRIDKISEALVIFRFIDTDIYRGLVNKLQSKTVSSKLRDYEMQAITDLVLVYSSIDLAGREEYDSGMIKSARMLAKGWRI